MSDPPGTPSVPSGMAQPIKVGVKPLFSPWIRANSGDCGEPSHAPMMFDLSPNGQNEIVLLAWLRAFVSLRPRPAIYT
jgi:hypothetical protein